MDASGTPTSFYDLRSLSATSNDYNGPAAVLLRDASGNQLNVQGTVVSALANKTFDTSTGEEQVDGFELFTNNAGDLNKLSFNVDGIQNDSSTLTSASEIRLAEIQTRTDLNNDGIVGAQIVELLSSGARDCLLYTSPSPRDRQKSRMPSSA